MPKRFYIETVGCQMNVLDSELIAAELLQHGYESVDSPGRADVILFNTCSVRQHAEEKIYSALGRLKHIKRQRPGTIIGVIGCMAQKDRQRIFRRAPHVDIIVGPGRLSRLPELLLQVESGAGPLLDISLDRTAGDRESVRAGFEPYQTGRSADARPLPQQAMVRVMSGCDKFCTYCIVPSVRGPEQSRPVDRIEAEVRQLAEQGCIEVTLLGQTVNNYRDATVAGRTLGLANLLERLHEIEGIERLRFVTNHPRHMTDELIEAVDTLPKVSPYFHVPAQSGSNRVLKRMNRGYTAEQYRKMLDRIRRAVLDAAITSDFIVGFPGETEEDYQQTVALVSIARFKNSFIFKYSPRPGTKAAELYNDDVPYDVKQRRNNELLAIQNAISLEGNRSLVGRRVEVLVEGPSKVARKRPSGGDTVQLVGRTVCDRIVVFDGPPELAGRIMPVKIDRAEAFTLFGKTP